jgi:ATP-binding cassette subfamily B (MDR/TAP) protein 1
MSATDSVDEKAPVSVKKPGFFSRKPKGKPTDKLIEKDDTSESDTTNVESTQPTTPPISFLQLFRFSTTFELVLDAIGLVAATAAGAAQVHSHVQFT